MSRNDAILNTGLAAPRSRQIAEKKEEDRKEHYSTRSQILPAAALVKDLIQSEREFCRTPVNIKDEYTTHEFADFQVEMKSIKRYDHYLSQLQAKVDALLRVPRRKGSE